jgi:type I restriction enzyme S subunit
MISKVDFQPFEKVFEIPLRNGLTKPKAIRGKGKKMINMGELFAHSRINNVQTDRVPFSNNENNYLLEPGDLLFARQSLVLAGAGKCSIFVGDDEAVTYEGHIIRARIDKKLAEPLFYYYFFNSPIGRQTIESIVEQVAAAGIRGSDLAKLNVPYPPLLEQRAIAGILGVLDDKIELNQRMNETLEAMARAVFQEMMKDGSFEERTIGEIVSVVGGSTPSTKNPDFWENGEIHWATPKDLSPLQSPILLDTNSCITDLGLREISSGLLPIGTVLLSSRAPIGYLAITEISVAINQGFIAIKCPEDISKYFILNWLKENMDTIKGRANGTTFLEISKSNFRPMKISVPSQKEMKTFDLLVGPLYQKIVTNLKESRTLASLRDSLLPKLMSGEVRVKDVEKLGGEKI